MRNIPSTLHHFLSRRLVNLNIRLQRILHSSHVKPKVHVYSSPCLIQLSYSKRTKWRVKRPSLRHLIDDPLLHIRNKILYFAPMDSCFEGFADDVVLQAEISEVGDDKGAVEAVFSVFFAGDYSSVFVSN